MPPNDRLTGSTVDLPNHSEEELQPQPPFHARQDHSGTPCPNAAPTMNFSPGTKDNANPAEKRKSEPVELLRYYNHNDVGGNKRPDFRQTDSLPILAPILANKSFRSSNSLPDVEKGEDNKGFCAETDHRLNGLGPPNASHVSIPTTNSSASLVPHSGDPDKGGESEAPETFYAMVIQVFIPFLIAGFGMVGAGLVLDEVQHWEVFQKISAIYVVVPPLLGLKGNLEMTLASRLSTLVNTGSMKSRKSRLTFIGGNMVISQCLASVIGFLTSLLAVLIGSIQDQEFNLNHSLVLIASSVATAAASSCILDSIMVMVILLSRRFGINPDNVATPIAASLGDITTTGLLAGIATALYGIIDKITWIGPIVTCVFLVLVPLWVYLAWRQPYTADALKTTCGPVIGAMFISTGGGFILNVAVKKYVDLAVFQPIINGVGGNLVAIQASRIATSLHQSCVMGILPSNHPSICISPCSVFHPLSNKHVRSALVLLSMAVPGHLIFIYTTSFISTGEAVLSFAFVVAYLIAAVLQVATLLYVATIIIYLVWRFKIDPDNFSIPLLTALGDLLGIGLLALAFLILEATGEKVAFVNS